MDECPAGSVRIRPMTALKCLAAALFVLSASAARGADWKIVLPPYENVPGVHDAITNAAHEMTTILEEGTGRRPAVFSARDKVDGPCRIFLGERHAEKAGLLPADLKEFANVVAEKDGDVYLFGRDRSGRPRVKTSIPWQECVLPTVKAATRFLEDCADVRFLAPGCVGRDVPRKDALAVPARLFSRQDPVQEYGQASAPDMLHAYANNIFGSGRHFSFKGHTYPTIAPYVYFKDHPDWYALWNGRRDPGVKGNPTLCISNPGVKEELVRQLAQRYNLGAEVVQLGQNDGDRHCQCADCKAFRGTAPNDWAEKFWLFHCEIAREIEKRYPGRIVRILAYSDTEHPPKTFKVFPSNVMIEICHPSEEKFREWDGYTVPHGFTVYTYLWGEYPRLGFTAHQSFRTCSETARMLNRNRCRGVFRCGYGELYGMEGPAYYVFNRTLETPDASPDRLVEEYCMRMFGPVAGRAMLSFYRTLDEKLANENGMNAHRWRPMPVDTLAYVYAPEVIRAMDRELARAERTPGLTESQKVRLRLVRTEYDYARNLGRIANLYNGYRMAPTVGTFRPLADELLARTEILDGIFSGPNGTKRGVPGWPEIALFGPQRFDRRLMATNGRLGATIHTPLEWNVRPMLEKGFLPGATVRRAKVPRVDVVPDFADFEGGAWKDAAWQDVGGFQLEELSFGTRFKAVFGPRKLYIAVESELPEGLDIKPQGTEGACHYVENAEVLIDPTGSRERYFRLIWNPVANSCWDEEYGRILDPLDPFYQKPDSRWHGWRGPDRWSYRTETKGRTWRSMCEVPYALMDAKRPEKGEVWCFNLGRGSYLHLKPLDRQWALWNPNLVNRDRRSRESMGELEAE